MPLTRRTLLTLGSAVALARPAWPYVLGELYRGRAIVTGRRPETRIPGMARALTQAVVRVSGDARLAASPALAGFLAEPEAAMIDDTYRDLYAFRPIRDEQGTRDRPYEMTVRFDPARIDAMLAAMGARPWLAPRPRLVVFLAVQHIASAFMLSRAGEAGELMRQSFQDAAWSAAMAVAIPTPGTLARGNIGVEFDPPPEALQALVARRGDLPLAGRLSWSRPLLAWRADWQLRHAGRTYRWGIAGVNFDAAFRNGVGGAALILSGNGTPSLP